MKLGIKSPQRVMALGALVVYLSMSGCRGKSAEPAAAEKTAKPLVQVTLAQVKRADINSGIPVTGTVVPLPDQEAKISPFAAGRISRIYVKTGDTVVKGQTIAVIESSTLIGQVRQAEAIVRSDAAALQQARYNLRAQQSSQAAAVVQAQTNVNIQQVALKKLLAGSRPQEIAQAQQSVTVAQAALTAATQSMARSQTLYSQGLLARKDLETAQAAERTAKAQLASANSALSMMKEGNRAEDVEAGRVAVRAAEEQLAAAKAQDVQNAAKEQDIRVAERQYEAAQGALSSVRAQMSAQTICSPFAGTVVGRTLNAGETADVTAVIATVVNLDRIRLVLNIHAAQVSLIHSGQSVEFTAESEPKTKLHATITMVNRAVDAATNTIQAEAVANNPRNLLRDDTYVRGRILTAVRRNAITAPADAIVEKEGKTVVFVVGGDSIAHMREVQVGPKEGTRAEVISGLREGDQVVTTGAFEIEDGTQVKTAE